MSKYVPWLSLLYGGDSPNKNVKQYTAIHKYQPQSPKQQTCNPKGKKCKRRFVSEHAQLISVVRYLRGVDVIRSRYCVMSNYQKTGSFRFSRTYSKSSAQRDGCSVFVFNVPLSSLRRSKFASCHWAKEHNHSHWGAIFCRSELAICQFQNASGSENGRSGGEFPNFATDWHKAATGRSCLRGWLSTRTWHWTGCRVDLSEQGATAHSSEKYLIYFT